MSERAHLTITAGHHRGPVTLTHPNDQDLHILVEHPIGATVRLETDDSAYSGRPQDPRTSRVTVPTSALTYRVGRMDAQVRVDNQVTDLQLDLLAPQRQAQHIRELVTELVRSPFALLAMPRAHQRPLQGERGKPDRIENLLEATRLFSEASQLLAANPPTRVSEVPAETPPGARLTASLLQAITHQPYALQPATPGPRTLPIHGRHYTAGNLHATVLTEDPDTPANRYVHGVGRALERLAHATRSDLTRERTALAEAPEATGEYVSIRQLTRSQAVDATRANLTKVEDALQTIRRARALLEKRLPVRAAHLDQAMAPKVLLDPRYARVRRALDLLRAPTTNEYGPEGLIASVTSLTTLYELYCLALLHDHIQHLGYDLASYHHDPTSGVPNRPHRILDGTEFPNVFTYSHAALPELTLHYEPRITRHPHHTTGLACVSARTSFLTPDIVITTQEAVIICDAKFTPTAPLELLPEATLKYLHGLAAATKTIAGLYLLHYGARAQALYYHDRPIIPAIATLPVHPHNHSDLTTVLTQHLRPHN